MVGILELVCKTRGRRKRLRMRLHIGSTNDSLLPMFIKSRKKNA